MSYEFCQPCKPMTKKKCAQCPRQRKQLRPQGEERMSVRPRLDYMGEIYTLSDKCEEEHF